jgi:hypothetical protein
MPEMLIRTEGAGGEFADVFRRHRRVEMPHNIPIRVETLDHGMKGGAPSCAFIIELPAERMVVLAQTSVKLFQMAAVATFAKYGDVTQEHPRIESRCRAGLGAGRRTRVSVLQPFPVAPD